MQSIQPRDAFAAQLDVPLERDLFLCMMTSNVFGAIAANNLGYAKVELKETIADYATGCRVMVYLKPTVEAEAAPGREYFQGLSTL